MILWRLVILILLATTAHAATVTVTKRGSGTGSVTGSITCPTDQTSCSQDFSDGSTLTFGFLADRSNASLLGWGGLCGQWENSPTCSFTLDDTAARRFSGRYPVVVSLGYFMDGICRASLVGPLNYLYTRSLEDAHAAVKAGTAYNPIDCLSGPILSIGNVDTALIFQGGWPDFTPNSDPVEGSLSTISGALVVTTGTFTITGNGGVTLACGYTTVDGPYTITTTPVIIGATQCDFGLIIR